ncbi:hypothetical protein DSM104443_00602 [Usitatibacter rugosus]|uniref:Uncharacterized protein n=1 Tax=Usitatibacter rugosus TaxID=2732067 RepID=A0A6M4GTD2_9PROT|nr:hypothetical protein [Usitatibacter rugosus]QJR09553.1 hypothetical protein DSM104443_00602 [Usitatibacter rugosus]
MKRILSILALLAAFPAAAAEYLIAPLIGDRLVVSFARMTTGSNLGASAEVLKFPKLPWDDAIATSVAEGVSAADDKATFKQLSFREGLPGVDTLDQAGEGEIAAALVKTLATLIDPAKKQYIVALWPRRADHLFKGIYAGIGRGRGSGLGFYVDRTTRTILEDTGERDTGFLGVFAYFDVGLIDPAASKVVARQRIVTTQHLTMAERPREAEKGDPWALLDDGEKYLAIRRMVVEQLGKAMPELMKGVAAAKP